MTHRNATRVEIGVVYVFGAYTMLRGRTKNPHSGFPLQVPSSCPFTISITPLVNNARIRRSSWRSSSTNASGITQKVIWKIFTHTTCSSGAENFVNQMGGAIGLFSIMVGSGSRVLVHCSNRRH
jgi:hypothetical protein